MILFGCILFPIALVLLLSGDGAEVGLYVLLVACLSLLIGIVWSLVKGSYDAKKSVENMQRQREIEKAQKETMFSTGRWLFPREIFFARCRESQLETFEQNFALQKAALIARSIMEKEGVPEQYMSLYYNNDKLNQYFDEYLQQYRLEKQKQKQEYDTPHDADLDDMDKRYLEKYREKLNLVGVAKRIHYIKEEILEQKAKKSLAQRRDENAQALAGMVSGAMVKPKNDWDIMGGLASGVAGPVAGAAVAMQSMAQDQAIRQHNANVIQTAAKIGSTAGDGNYSYYDNNIAELEKELRETECKVVFEEFTTKQLFDALEITAVSMKDKKPNTTIQNSKRMHFEVSITNHLASTMGGNVKQVVDGSIWVSVYCDDIFVEKVGVALPKYGILCDGGNTAGWHATTKYMLDERQRKFSFKFEPNHLWLMEQ